MQAYVDLQGNFFVVTFRGYEALHAVLLKPVIKIKRYLTTFRSCYLQANDIEHIALGLLSTHNRIRSLDLSGNRLLPEGAQLQIFRTVFI